MTRNDPIKHFFIWPALIIVLLISIFPLVYSLTTSFMSMRLVPPTPSRFAGSMPMTFSASDRPASCATRQRSSLTSQRMR